MHSFLMLIKQDYMDEFLPNQASVQITRFAIDKHDMSDPFSLEKNVSSHFGRRPQSYGHLLWHLLVSLFFVMVSLDKTFSSKGIPICNMSVHLSAKIVFAFDRFDL